MKGFVRVFIFAAAVTALVSCSSTPTRRSFKEYWKDQLVGTKVRYKLIKDKDVKFSHMKVQMWKGIATITGRALSQYEKDKAERLAVQTKGVIGVKNYLDVVGGFGETVATPVDTKGTGKYKGEKEKVVVKEGIKEETLKDSTVKRKTKAEVVAKESVPVKTATTVKKGPVKKAETVVEKKPIKSQMEAARWYQNINRPVTATSTSTAPAPTTEYKGALAERKELSQPEPRALPQDDLAREAAEELRKLRGGAQ